VTAVATIDGNSRWVYALIAGVILLMFLLALAVWLDSEQRLRLERMIEPTAVGEPVSLKVDPRENPGRSVLNWKSQPYFLRTNQLVKLPEFDAYKVGRDDSGQIALYQIKKQRDLRVVLVKIGHDEFLPLTPR
jgi:CHASE1-domain containing sensor protein